MKKILSIDGGGIKGVFPASVLATIEDSINDKISNYFDLIVGTSTGGIIALGLGLGLSAKEILDFYVNLGPRVFKRVPVIQNLKQWLFSKYSHKPLREALESTFGEKKLGESTKRLVIPSMNLETGEVYIYKTSHHQRFVRDYKEKVVDIALATAAAPTFFPTHRTEAGTPLIDGGMWANNPVGLAVVEAISILEWPREDLKVLSLGCTTQPLSVCKGRDLPLGRGYWAIKIIDVFMTAQSSHSFGTAKLLVGPNNLYRISPVVETGRFGLDTYKEIPSLKGLGNSEARKALPDLRDIFFSEIVEPFVPYNKL